MGECGHRTQAGGRCQWPAEECPHHTAKGRARARQARRAFPAPQSADAEADRRSPPLPLPREVIARRDLRGLGWWAITELIGGELQERRGTVLASLVRTLAALGPEPTGTAEALREVELRGLLMQGVPPRSAEEWERAARLFAAQALAEFARWPALREDDAGDDLEPLLLGDAPAHEVQVPLAGDDEEGVVRDV